MLSELDIDNLLPLVLCAESNTEQLYVENGKHNGECSILLAELLAIREAFIVIVEKNLSNIIIESDLKLFFSLSWELLRFRVLLQILLRILYCLLLYLGILRLIIVKHMVSPADMVARKAHPYIAQIVIIYQ